MKKLGLSLWLFLVCITLAAQRDSIALVCAPWQTDTIQQGIVLKRHHFVEPGLFAANQNICLLEIAPGAPVTFEFGYEPRRTTTSEIAQKHGALAAINGSFFDMDLHNPVCYLRIDSVEVGVNTPGNDPSTRKYYQYGAIVLDQDSLYLIKTESERLWERTQPYSNIMTSGPLLLKNGQREQYRTDRTFVTNRHPRSAVGIRPDGTILFFTVDGRIKESAGMSLEELTRTLEWLGCTEAINLDGGGSTTMYVYDYPENGIVNCPVDNGRFDHQGERAVSNILMIKTLKK
ncbi:MAG: phosphodiester glycosidase family protein [Bacteroidales bacterium]|nr:phosphodiester glycosidase family protein [Bacteroidales bacterium]